MGWQGGPVFVLIGLAGAVGRDVPFEPRLEPKIERTQAANEVARLDETP
jgi:hypothetical protein